MLSISSVNLLITEKNNTLNFNIKSLKYITSITATESVYDIKLTKNIKNVYNFKILLRKLFNKFHIVEYNNDTLILYKPDSEELLIVYMKYVTNNILKEKMNNILSNHNTVLIDITNAAIDISNKTISKNTYPDFNTLNIPFATLMNIPYFNQLYYNYGDSSCDIVIKNNNNVYVRYYSIKQKCVPHIIT